MLTSSQSLVILSLIAALVWQPAGTVAGAGGPPQPGALAPQAPNALAWYDGLIEYSTITNCVSIIQGSPYSEYGAGTYVGFAADPINSQPVPNAPYYAHVVIYGLGNACSGMRAYIDLALPANTALDIGGAHPVYCFYDGVAFGAPDCPQVLPASSINPGAFQIPSSDAAHGYTWPIPQGHNLEIQVPLVSSTTLTNSPMQANVWMLDGNDSPTLRPQQGVYVFSGGGSTTTIIYPSPATITVTATTARSQAYLYTNLGGTGYFDLGTTTSYSLAHDSVPISSGGTAWLAWDDWGPPPLLPDTLYHWRFTFHDSNGHDTLGADQTFRTLPSGQVTIGDGTPANCNAPSFEAALPTAKSIVFNCGALPITLTLTSPHPITTDLTIDGGNKVTLDAGGTGRHFDVQSGAALTLTSITLVNANSGFNCGGSIQVGAGARLSLSQTRFIKNHSSLQGGAVCIQGGGSASIADNLFLDNHAGSHGGAIGNYGSVDISGTRFVSNTAPTNGGAIDTTGRASLTGTTFVSNTAGYRGGGINNYLGLLTMASSSFISNTAGAYGGGLSNDSSGTSLTSTTFSGNYSNDHGGAIETAGTLTLTNSTLSANHAQNNGGGLDWVAVTATVTLLNDTVVSNTAGLQGGNIYAGGAPNVFIKLKNTLVAFGSPNNCDDTVATQGHNLESTNTCGFSAGSGDVLNAAPKIGPLQNNGGPTLTHALKGGSAALDAGTNAGCPATDQRGVARPQDGDGNGSAVCDIGAYEATPGSTLTNRLYLPLVRR